MKGANIIIFRKKLKNLKDNWKFSFYRPLTLSTSAPAHTQESIAADPTVLELLNQYNYGRHRIPYFKGILYFFVTST